VRAFFQQATNVFNTLTLRGGVFHCPICVEDYQHFLTFGVAPPRRNAVCPGCRSFERHRLLWIVLEQMKLLPTAPGKRLLHVAPETCLSSRLAGLFEYVSIDAGESIAQIQMDVTQLKFPDEYFDAIICNHVLEHVADDGKALAELHRVLRNDGWAIIQVPMEGDVTEEDLSVTDPAERTRLYGQSDHLRRYGKDFMSRLQHSGFSVQVIAKQQLLDRKSQKKISVACEDSVWISRKKRMEDSERP